MAAPVSLEARSDADASHLALNAIRDALGEGWHDLTVVGEAPGRVFCMGIRDGWHARLTVLPWQGGRRCGVAYTAAMRRIARVDHPHLAPMREYGVTDHFAWCATDRRDDVALAERCGSGPLPYRDTMRVMHQVAGALDCLHHHGLVHGGLDAHAVLIDASGWVRVTDAGASRILTDAAMAVSPRAWPAGLVVAPEQGAQRPCAGGPSVDQYLLGILLKALMGEERAEGAMPAHARAAVARATAPDPGARFPSVMAFVAALERAVPEGVRPSAPARLTNWAVAVPLPDSPPPEAPAASTRRWVARLGVAAAAVGVVAVGGMLRSVPPPEAPAAIAVPPVLPVARPVVAMVVPPPAAPTPGPSASPPVRPPDLGVDAFVPPLPVVVLPGALSVASHPWGYVEVDGRRVGHTPLAGLSVPAGTHHVRVLRDGFQTFDTVVTVPSGGTLRLTRIVLQGARP